MQQRVNGILSLRQHSLVPEVTTSSLSISSATSGNPGYGMTQLGAGLELDISATRLRLIGRYRFGENVTGWSIGLGVSF